MKNKIKSILESAFWLLAFVAFCIGFIFGLNWVFDISYLDACYLCIGVCIINAIDNIKEK